MRIDRSFVVQFIGVVAILLSSLSCNKQRALSDHELALIFRDAFISNAYSTNTKLKLDSLRLYEPIFEKYGYTTADVQYTIGNFANRKSARLSDVVENAIDMLEEVGDELDYQVAILDTIDNIAVRRTIRTIYQEPLLEMRSARDTTKFTIKLEDLDEGNYTLEFKYLVDSLDKTKGNYLSKNWIENLSDEPKKGESRDKIRLRNAVLGRNTVAKFESSFTVNDTAQMVVISLAMPSKFDGAPHVTIKDLVIKNKPSYSQARNDLFWELSGITIFDDELLFKK